MNCIGRLLSDNSDQIIIYNLSGLRAAGFFLSPSAPPASPASKSYDHILSVESDCCIHSRDEASSLTRERIYPLSCYLNHFHQIHKQT